MMEWSCGQDGDARGHAGGTRSVLRDCGDARSATPSHPALMRPAAVRRPGLTLAELCLVLAIIGLMTTIASRQLLLFLDRSAARSAIAEAASVVVRARDEAIAQRAM